jgi:hypothetical protein
VNHDLPDVEERKLLIVSVILQADRERASAAAPERSVRMCLGCLMVAS